MMNDLFFVMEKLEKLKIDQLYFFTSNYVAIQSNTFKL